MVYDGRWDLGPTVLGNEIRYRGDWAKKVKNVEPSGWAFERANLHYPDIDDTSVEFEETLLAVDELIRKGKVRYFGDYELVEELSLQDLVAGPDYRVGLSGIKRAQLLVCKSGGALYYDKCPDKVDVCALARHLVHLLCAGRKWPVVGV